MVYLFALDDTKTEVLNLTLSSGNLIINGTPATQCAQYANFGIQITGFPDGFASVSLGTGLEYDPFNFLFTSKTKSYIPSFFDGVESIIKPSDFRMKHIVLGTDILLFFGMVQDMYVFIHNYLSVRPYIFNDKNHRFNCTIFQDRCEVFLSNGLKELILDLPTFSYSSLSCEGSTITEISDTAKYIITLRLKTDNRNPTPKELIALDTATYKLVFPSNGNYLLNVSNNNFYPLEFYSRVTVC